MSLGMQSSEPDFHSTAKTRKPDPSALAVTIVRSPAKATTDTCEPMSLVLLRVPE